MRPKRSAEFNGERRCAGLVKAGARRLRVTRTGDARAGGILMDRAGTIARSLGHRHSYDDAALNAGANHYRCIRSGPSGSNAADTQLSSDCGRLVERKLATS